MVMVKTFDTLFADYIYKPTLVKSDTQGSEARIVRGASRLFVEGWRPLNGHLKSGHLWSLQNRPFNRERVRQDSFSLSPPDQASPF